MGPAGLADDSLRKWSHRTLIHVAMHALGMVRTLSMLRSNPSKMIIIALEKLHVIYTLEKNINYLYGGPDRATVWPAM